MLKNLFRSTGVEEPSSTPIYSDVWKFPPLLKRKVWWLKISYLFLLLQAGVNRAKVFFQNKFPLLCLTPLLPQFLLISLSVPPSKNRQKNTKPFWPVTDHWTSERFLDRKVSCGPKWDNTYLGVGKGPLHLSYHDAWWEILNFLGQILNYQKSPWGYW